jgi:hypothetical protein
MTNINIKKILKVLTHYTKQKFMHNEMHLNEDWKMWQTLKCKNWRIIIYNFNYNFDYNTWILITLNNWFFSLHDMVNLVS